MSNLFSRACALFVVFGGLGIGACASPSGPSADTVGQPDTRRRTWPAVSTGRFLWADGDLPWSYGHDAREYRLDLYRRPTPA